MGFLALGMQDIAPCRSPSHDLPGLESSRKTLVLRPLVLIGSTNVSTCPLGGPSSIRFSADVLWAGLVSSCRVEDSSHNMAHGSQVHYVKDHLLIVEQALSFRQALGSFFS